MGRIPEATIDEIRNRVDVVDFVGRYVELRRAGRNFKGLCPFHNEKTPSFNVNPDRQIFHCFGCAAGGDVIGFLMKHENLTFPEAAGTLARELGIEIPQDDGRDRGISERIYAALELAGEFYRQALQLPDAAEAREARDYLSRRGLSPEDLECFGIGYAPDRWDALSGALGRKSIPGDLGEKAGLLAERRSGGHYDRLRGRVIFPISDVRGRVVAFGGRALGADQEPKYLNTPESPVFRKRESFYGFPEALEPIRRSGRAIICEGYFDRIALHRAGMGEALATCGTALTREHANQLRRRTREVVLLFDGDEAGGAAMERALEVLLPEGLRVRAAILPAGQDPDSLLEAEGAEALRRQVDSSPPAIDSVIERALAGGIATPSEKADAVGHVAPLLALVADPVERAEFVRRLAASVGADLSAVETVVRGASRGRSAPRLEASPELPRRADSREERHLRLLTALVLHHPDLASPENREWIETLLPDGSWKAVLMHLLSAAQEAGRLADGGLDVLQVEVGLDEEARTRLREIALAEAPRTSEKPAEQAMQEVFAWFRRQRQKQESQDTTRQMRQPQSEAEDLLARKQRQLEERRAALGISSGTPGSSSLDSAPVAPGSIP